MSARYTAFAFVPVDGKFFPCERVDEESSELCIGDLKNGFDLENAKKILNVAEDNGKRMQGMLVLQNVFSMCGKSWREER